MSTIPFSSVDLQKADIDAITEIFDTLQNKFSVSYDTNFSYDFRTLEIFRNRETNVGPAIRITNNPQSFDLVFIHVGYSYSYARMYSFGLTYEYQTFGVASLKSDFGQILIKPQTLSDKIHELIDPIELRFPDDPKFNSHVCVVTTDEVKARSCLSDSFRTSIKSLRLNDFVIEIRNNKLIIGNRKIIQRDSAIAIASFMDDLSRLPGMLSKK